MTDPHVPATPAPSIGENIATLRKAAGLSQNALRLRAGISMSLLSKIEIGDRPCTPAVAASVARALGVTMAQLNGQVQTRNSGPNIDAVRSAVRRYDLPHDRPLPAPETLSERLATATTLRAATRYDALALELPALIDDLTAHAHAVHDPARWGMLADAYACAYTLAHRLGQPDLAEIVVGRQAWAAERAQNPVASAGAAWTRAGTFQSAGDYDGGMAVVEEAISRYGAVQADQPSAVVALGALHLRAITLASRAKDASATAEHTAYAHRLAEVLPIGDVLAHNLTFGAGNTHLHVLAAHVELDQPQKAASLADGYTPGAGLTPTRVGHFHLDTARAHLAVGDRDASLRSLRTAERTAPQMTRVHPMAREVARVLLALHRRSNPELVGLASRLGIAP